MNNSFSLKQLSRTGNLDSNLISRQFKLNLMADFMRIKIENPELKQFEIANQLACSTRTLQRCRNEVICFHLLEFNKITLINAKEGFKYKY